MWLLPLLVLGAVGVAIAIGRPREVAHSTRHLAYPQPQQLGLPGPISVLGEFVRAGRRPPDAVILCAIAEAESIGRGDLATDLVKVFVAPVVYQHQLARAKRTHQYERGTCAFTRSPRGAVDARPQQSAMPPPPPSAAMPAPAPQRTMPSSDEEIREMLNTDPEGFIRMVTHGVPMTAPVVDAPVASPTTPPIEQPMPAQDTQPTGLPPEAVAQMQEDAGLHAAADQTRALAPGSPLTGVPDGAWREFVMRLEREAPTFQSNRHVGQYRQRRERLAELGIDPSTLGSAQAQRSALDTDLADAHHHAVHGGLCSEHIGRPIVVPGREESEVLSLSGLLGVIQCAGLDGAVGWLERPSDRRRYPHTTQAFLRTNGVF